MPLRTLHPEEDHKGVRPVLRQGFEALVNLGECVSVEDELYLHVHFYLREESPVWATCWPRLRRLYLYNVMLDDEI